MKSKFSIVILFISFIYSNSSAQDIKVLSSDFSGITIEFTPNYIDTSSIILNGQKFFNPTFSFGQISNDDSFGNPMIFSRKINFGVPDEFAFNITLLQTEYFEKQGLIMPVPFPKKQQDIFIPDYRIGDNYYIGNNTEIIALEDFGLIRDIPVQSILINPVIFNSSDNSIRFYKKIVLRFTYNSVAAKTSGDSKIDSFLKGIIINYDVAKNWKKAKEQLGKISNSLLASGTWYRFEATEEGIYKISRDMLPSLGIDPETVDPRTIKIYNNGGYILPTSESIQRPTDLVENNIYIFGAEDGKFDQSDYVLFYGRGVNFWEYNKSTGKIIRNTNPFSFENYYFITSGGILKKELEKISSGSGGRLVVSTKAYISNEEDIINLGKSGREFYGAEFNENVKSRTFTNQLTRRIDGSKINYNFRFINAGAPSGRFEVEESGSTLYNRTVSGYGNNDYIFGISESASGSYSGNLTDDRSLLRFFFDASGPSARGHLDFFEIEYERELFTLDDQLVFYSPDSNGLFQYRLRNFSTSDIRVFDITDFSEIKEITNAVISGGEFIFSDKAESGNIKKYIGVNPSAFKTPTNFSKVTNSNLRGESVGGQYVVITHQNFHDAAMRLRDFRANESVIKNSSIVVDIDLLFNEFAGGLKDPTAIRDFLKYAYSNWQIKPEYVLLFGDGTYDYRNIENFNNNFIPSFQTQESLLELQSYSSDDYFSRISGNDNKPDLAIGRLNINSLSEANVIVDKIIEYENNSKTGTWKNLITLVADDKTTSRGEEPNLHTPQSESLTRLLPPYFDEKKIYLALYPTVVTGLGSRKPEVNDAIINAINEGTVILNYIGHGSPEVWAHEYVFEKSSSIAQMNNENYFFLTAATCDFGLYDNPSVQSSAELMNSKKGSGSIGAFTSARPVYSVDNAQLNEDFFKSLFEVKDTMGYPIPIGKAYLNTKTRFTDVNDQKFHLLADPLLRLAIPTLPVSVDSVNGSYLDTTMQIKALGSVSIVGNVRRIDGTINNGFNGEGIVTVYDSKRILEVPELDNYKIELKGGTIFRGRVSITNGKFKTEFTVPKDISYENNNGKIIVYIFNEEFDGIGSSENIIINDADSSVNNDGKGPDIEIYYDNLSFDNGYLVNKDFSLLVKLSDDTGLNTTGTGIGHKLEGILNEDLNNPIDFTDYFIGDLNAGGKSGLIDFKFSNLNSGEYNIKVKAWDVFNNLAVEESYFTVVDDEVLTVRNIVNYPNPFSSSTTFTFQHNIDDALNVKIKIYTIAGRLIKEIENETIYDRFVKINWDGRDEDGAILSNGTYLYKLLIETSDNIVRQSHYGKLSIMR